MYVNIYNSQRCFLCHNPHASLQKITKPLPIEVRVPSLDSPPQIVRPWLISMQRYCKLVSYYNENKLQGLQINVFSEWEVWVFGMFEVILHRQHLKRQTDDVLLERTRFRVLMFTTSSWEASALWLRCSLLSLSSPPDEELPGTAPLLSLVDDLYFD